MTSLIRSAIIGLVFLIPFIALEVINRWKFNETFPFTLFIFAWLLQTLFTLLLTPIITNLRSGITLIKNRFVFLLRILSLLLVAYIWSGWVIDQWPCLMGIPNCD